MIIFSRRPLISTLIFGVLAFHFSVHCSTIWAAPETVSTPKAGSKTRKAILDALRKPVSVSNQKKVIFTRVKINASRSYAFVEAASVDAKGKAVGPPMPLQAFLRKVGAKWRVLEWTYAGDVISIEWEKKYRAAPKKIWPHNYY